jgi:AcrR family transcriptional regulator
LLKLKHSVIFAVMQKNRLSRPPAAVEPTPSPAGAGKKRLTARAVVAAAAGPAGQDERRARGRPRKTPGELDDGNRRRQIIDGAARLFRTKGFAAASTRDIAAAAGMRSGSPFYHFESKSALLYVVMEEGMAHAAQSQQAALDRLAADASPRDRLRALVRSHFEILLGPDSDFIPVMLYEWRSLTAEQRQGIASIKDGYEAQWMPVLQALSDGGALQAEPALARLFIFGALNWAVQWFSPQRGKSIDELTAQALLLFIGEA